MGKTRFTRTLSAQLLGLLTLALLPLGLISLYQTQQVYDEALEANRGSLMAQTIAAASGERDLIQEAFGAGETIAAALEAIPSGQCAAVLERLVVTQPSFLFAGFIPIDGKMVCSSSGEPYDFSQSSGFADLVERATRFVSFIPDGPISKQDVVAVSHPVWKDGKLNGFITISLPHRLANALMPAPNTSDGLVLATFNSVGDVVSATRDLERAGAFLPRDMAKLDLIDRVGTTFTARAKDGHKRLFAVSEIVNRQLVIVGSWPMRELSKTSASMAVFMPLVFPLLMWGVGIFVAYLGLQRLVLRHISALRSAMRRFALGERGCAALALNNPPEELADAQRAFNRMARIISENETRIDQDLKDKEVLLKEVHHRVKNNLQLIASIMNMQARSAKSVETKTMLAGMQRRVRGLATLHRTLYTTVDQTTINGRDMILTVAEDISHLVSIRGLKIETEADPVNLFPDQAVPLSMLLSEALTNAVKYVGKPATGPAYVRVQMQMTEDGEVNLTISNSKGRFLQTTDDLESGGLGTRLMRAFVRQLDGEQTVEETDDAYIYRVQFQAKGFEPEQTDTP